MAEATATEAQGADRSERSQRPVLHYDLPQGARDRLADTHLDWFKTMPVSDRDLGYRFAAAQEAWGDIAPRRPLLTYEQKVATSREYAEIEHAALRGEVVVLRTLPMLFVIGT